MSLTTLGGGISKPTTEALEVDIVGNRENPDDAPKTEERKIDDLVGQIIQRFEKMRMARPDSEWQTFVNLYEANWYPRADGLSNVIMPLASATIRNKIADELSSLPLVTFLPTGKDDIEKIDITQVSWNHVWDEAKTSKELIKVMYSRSIYGSAVWFEGLEMKTRIINDPVDITEGKKNTFKKKKLVSSRLVGRYVDVRKFYIDPVPDIELAEDCIEVEVVTMSQLESMKFDPNFDADAIDRVIASLSNPEDGEQVLTTEDIQEQGGHRPLVTLWHYWNKMKDQYVVVANRLEAIRIQPIPFAHKQLPYSVVPDELILGSMYGRGICKIVMNSIAELQAVRNIMIDGMKMSATTNLLVGEDISIPVKESVFGGEIWNVEGDLSQIRELGIRDKSAATFNVFSAIMEDITIFTGIDNRSLLGSFQKTAFEARLQEQTKIKGIAVNMRNVDVWLERWGNQRLMNMMQFFTKTYTERIVGERERVSQDSRSILLEDQRVTISNVGDKKKREFKKQKGFGVLELTGDELRSTLRVRVKTRTTTPILEAIRIEQTQSVLEQLNQLIDIKQKALQSGDPALAKLDTASIMEQIIIDSSLSPDNMLIKEAKDVKSIIGDLNKDLPLPPKPDLVPIKSQ